MRLFLDPQSVVLIGVSRRSGPGAYNNLEMMLRYGYKGQVFVVHPKVDEILGYKTFPRVADLPTVPDLAVISVGRDRVLPAFFDCVEKGLRQIIVISQGFADADDHGKEMQKDLVDMARKYEARVMGPNTMGVLNAFTGFSTAFVDIARESSPPPLTMVVQSGVFQVGFESFTGHIGKAIDVGNAGDLDFLDVLDYLENDPQTRIIVLHMEGMRRGREFLSTAARIARKKPIIVLKTGGSAAGAKAALSHTGSLVGDDAVFDIAFARAGLVRVADMVEMRAVSKAFLRFGAMKGTKLGVATATGACGIMAADACETYGLQMASFPEKIRGELENAHIAWHRLNNPVDLWPLGMVTGSFSQVFKQATCGLLNDEGVDALLGIVPALASPLHEDIDVPETVRQVNQSNLSRKPIALWLYGGDQDRVEKALENEPNVGCFDSIDEAVMGLSSLARYERLRSGERDPELLFGPLRVKPERPVSLPPRSLLVGESLQALLAHYKIPPAPAELVQTPDGALAAASALGYPVVLKIVSPAWLHKSDWGGVRLGVESDEKLMSSFAELKELHHRRTPEGSLEGILVQRQMGGTELLLGIKKDPQFGPILLLGMGGIYTEVFRDVAQCLAPVDRQDAERMLQSLRMYPILTGVRGQKGVSLSHLVDTIVSLSNLAMDYPEISELDLNPLLAGETGCWCVDCRLVTE